MAIEYRISIQTRNASGFHLIAEFFIGNDRQFAKDLFGMLKGSRDNIHDGLLLMELREINGTLPFDIQLIHCTLDEVMYNCRLITKHKFQYINLGK